MTLFVQKYQLILDGLCNLKSIYIEREETECMSYANKKALNLQKHIHLEAKI